MDDRIRLALLGVGRWGNHLLRNFLALPTVNLVAVVELNPDRRTQIRDQFDLDPGITLTDDADEILARSDVDAVAIATPAATHYPLIKTALKHGKHVLAEKPLTLQVSECHELCALAAVQQRQLVIDHTYLFNPVVQAGQQALAEAPLGTLRYGYAARTNLGPVRPDVDALWDLSIHDIAIFNHWLGEMPMAVSAQGQSWLQPDICPTNQFPQGLADVVWLRLLYPSGFQATIHVSWANPDKQRRLAVVGDRGTLIFDELQSEAPLIMQRGHFQPAGKFFSPQGLTREVLSVPSAEPLKQVCLHFLQCVRDNQPSPLSSGEMGTTLVKILGAISDSLKQDGQQILLSEAS